MTTLRSILQWAVPIVATAIITYFATRFEEFRSVVLGICIGTVCLGLLIALCNLLYWLYGH